MAAPASRAVPVDARTTAEPATAEHVRGLVLGVVAVVALASVAATYTFPFVVHAQPEPAWFRQVAPVLPEGTVVLPSRSRGARPWDGRRLPACATASSAGS